MKKSPSNLPGEGAGVPTPAPPLGWGKRLLILVPVVVASSVVAWQSGIAIGQLLAQRHLREAHDGLPMLEFLSQQVAATVREQGICLDAPTTSPAPDADTASQIDSLRDRIAIQTPCVDLAIAQMQFATLQFSRNMLHLIQQKQLFTTGLVTDSLAYRAQHSGHPDRYRRKSRHPHNRRVPQFLTRPATGLLR